MTKFCTNCGNPLDETASFCERCGAPNPDHAASGSRSLAKRGLGGPKRNRRRRLSVIIGVLAAVTVCLVLVITLSSRTGYRGVIRKYVKAVENVDGWAAAELVSDAQKEGFNLDDSDIADIYEWQFETDMDSYEERVGRDVRLSWKLDDFDVMEKRERDNFVDMYDSMGMDMDDIKKVAEAEIVLDAKGRDKEREYEIELTLVKENGKWKLWGNGLFIREP